MLLLASCGSEASSDSNTNDEPERVDSIEHEPFDSIAYYDSVYDNGLSHIEYMIDSLRAIGQFNGAYLIAKGDHILAEEYLGYANFSSYDTITPETRFQVASITKPFTCLAILMLAQQGKIDFTANVKTYLPDFPYDGITLEMLMSHTSGLGEYIFFMDKIWEDQNVPLTNDSLYRWMVKNQPTVFRPPNTKHEYNNLGFAILATIVERVSGQTFPSFLQENVYQPAGMDKTYIWMEGQENEGPYATGYAANMGDPGNDFLNGVYGDKGTFSTVRDLHAFSRAFFSQQLLTDDSLFTTMQEPHCAIKEDSTTYGLGWRIIYPDDKQKIIHHTGWWDGYRSNLVYYPDMDITLVVTTNWYKGPFFNHIYLKQFGKWLRNH